MPAPEFDLQSHSLHSDGFLTPTGVVEAAAAAGVRLLALSDHDTVDGVQEAIEAAQGVELDIVPAVELTIVDPEGEDLHVLGYGIDHRAPALLERLEEFRADRDTRAVRMVAKLRELGWEVDDAPLERRRQEGATIGRPHLARAVLDHPGNAQRLADEGLSDIGDVIRNYLIAGKPAFLSRTTPTIDDAVSTIHDAGGVAVWAHPFWDIEDPDRVVAVLERFAAAGLDGVEAFYVTHTREQTLLLVDTAERLGLLTTGSADFHGPEHKHFPRFRAFELHGREPRLGPIAGG